jgi:hypothetical protein
MAQALLGKGSLPRRPYDRASLRYPQAIQFERSRSWLSQQIQIFLTTFLQPFHEIALLRTYGISYLLPRIVLANRDYQIFAGIDSQPSQNRACPPRPAVGTIADASLIVLTVRRSARLALDVQIRQPKQNILKCCDVP